MDLKVQKKNIYRILLHFHHVAILALLNGLNPCLRDHELYYISRGLHRHHHHVFSLYPLDMEVDFQNFQRLIIFTRGDNFGPLAHGSWISPFGRGHYGKHYHAFVFSKIYNHGRKEKYFLEFITFSLYLLHWPHPRA